MQHSRKLAKAVSLLAFDVLELDGAELRRAPLVDRKSKLQNLLARPAFPSWRSERDSNRRYEGGTEPVEGPTSRVCNERLLAWTGNRGLQSSHETSLLSTLRLAGAGSCVGRPSGLRPCLYKGSCFRG